jgi:hypothetical protein
MEYLKIILRTRDLRFCCLAEIESWQYGSSLPLFGWVNRYAEPGDKIAIIHGLRFPVLLRLDKNGCYRFMGISYIQGLMDGEAMTMDGFESEYIKLC